MGVLPRLPPVGAQVVGGNYAGPGFSLDVYRLTLPTRLVTRCRQGSSRGSACQSAPIDCRSCSDVWYKSPTGRGAALIG